MTGTEPQPPPFDSGPNDHGAAIVVVTYSFMFISLCFAILRVHATIRRKREFGWDDITLLVATVGIFVNIGCATRISLECLRVLGDPHTPERCY